MHRSLLSAIVLGAALLAAPDVARAADVFVERLSATGLPDDAEVAFHATVVDAFKNAGHDVVPRDRAAFHAAVRIEKDRSRYELKVKATAARSGKVVADRSAECAPCTLDAAEQQIRLLVRTVSLDMAAADQAPPPPPALAFRPPSPPPAQVQQAAPPPRPQPPRVEFTGWYRAMMWTGVVAGSVGIVNGFRVVDGIGSRCGPSGQICEEPGDTRRLTVATAITIGAAPFAIWSALDILLNEPGDRHAGKKNAWAGLLTAASLAASSYLLVKNDGYGRGSSTVLGYVAIPLSALTAVTSIGTLTSGVTRQADSVTAFVGPGMVGAHVRF